MFDEGGLGYVWQQPQPTATYEACKPMTLSQGTIYLATVTINIETPVTYTPVCRGGAPVTLVANNICADLPLLNTMQPAWQDWIKGDGMFIASVFPLLYSSSMCMFVGWLIAIASLGSWRKRPLLLKLSYLVSCIYLTTMFLLMTKNLREQHYRGYICTFNLLKVYSQRYIEALCLGFNVIVLFSGVQMTMDLLDRKREKYFAMIFGIISVSTCQLLWGISLELADETVLGAFSYLLQVGLALLYSLCVFYYLIRKRTATLHPSLLTLTIITVMMVILPIVLFIVDVNDWLIINWVDSVDWIATLLSIAVVYEWRQRVEEKYTELQQLNILGYQIFEDDFQSDSGMFNGVMDPIKQCTIAVPSVEIQMDSRTSNFRQYFTSFWSKIWPNKTSKPKRPGSQPPPPDHELVIIDSSGLASREVVFHHPVVRSKRVETESLDSVPTYYS